MNTTLSKKLPEDNGGKKDLRFHGQMSTPFEVWLRAMNCQCVLRAVK